MTTVILAVAYGVTCACFCAAIWGLNVKLNRTKELMEMYKSVADEYLSRTLMETMEAIRNPKYYKGRAQKKEEDE